MARATKLKVYRTAIGFHDAYVAAPSQKAALEAWGAKADLFARGVAERVDDPELSREPLAKAGEIVRRSRGTTAEQLAALPPDRPKATHPSKTSTARTKSASPPLKPKPKPKPKPSRQALSAAERALENADAEHDVALADLTRREKALVQERRETEQAHSAQRKRLEAASDKERVRYERALDRWRG